MKLKKLKSICFYIVLACLVWSCYDDKGNYDYIELNSVTIDTVGTGILSEYALFRYDTLTIEPVVYFNNERVTETDTNNPNLEFYWTIYHAHTGVGVNYTVDTLGRSVKFNAPITRVAGAYTLQLTVKQKETQIEAYHQISLQVDESISDGWMVLYEREGNTDAGLIVNDRIKRNVLQERLFVDLYSASNEGKRLAGKPIRIVHSVPRGIATGGLVLMASAGGLVGVDRNTFEVTHEFEKLFWEAPAQNLGWIGATMLQKEMLICDNQVYGLNFMIMGGNNLFGVPCRGDYGELADWGPDFFGSSYDGVVYDKTNQCFKCIATNDLNVRAWVQQGNSDLDVNTVGMEMICSDWGRNNNEYTIFANGSNYALTVCNFFMTNPNTSQIMLNRYDMSNCPGISSVSSMASAVNGEFIYYASGGHLYLFEYNTGENAREAWVAPSADEVITCVRLQKFYFQTFMQAGILINPHQVIYIATWNENTQTGTVYQCLCNPSNGLIDVESQRRYSGFGKVKDMSWKWTM